MKEYQYQEETDVMAACEQDETYKSHNPEMRLAWQYVADTGISVFLTGKAGTGKTTFLKRLRELSPKRMVVLAPTAVAAINAGGQTIHSFFQIAPGLYVPGQTDDRKNHYMMSDKKKQLIRTIDLIVIDEVSMVRADLLDAIDEKLRMYRDRAKPFGGVQLLMIGDLMQLSPVAKEEEWKMLSPYYQTPYFYGSRALANLQYVTVELKHIYRQQDEKFINLLGHVRRGEMSDKVIRALNARYIPNFEPKEDGWVRLSTHNDIADAYNAQKLTQLPGQMVNLKSVVKGAFPNSLYPISEYLQLKVGAQVMFVKNDPQHRYYNGKIGKVVGFVNDQEVGFLVHVQCSDDSDGENVTIRVSPLQWENKKYEIAPETKAIKEKIDGTFTQYPLRLAWAITVHKSQGLTFDRAILDLERTFAHGQTYVALSRCRTLEGMVLTSPIGFGSVITDNSVNAYVEHALEEGEKFEARLPELKAQYLITQLDDLYSFRAVDEALRWLERVVDEHLSRQQPELLGLLKERVQRTNAELVNVGYGFGRVYQPAIQQQGTVALKSIQERIKKSAEYYDNKLVDIFQEVYDKAVINIENKAVAETYARALQGLKLAVNTKLAIFRALKEQDFTVGHYLDLKACAMLKGEDLMAPKRRPTATRRERQRAEREPKKPKADTLAETLKLYQQKLTPEEIASKRGLVLSTIYGHLAKLVKDGYVNIDNIVAPEIQSKIRETVATFDGPYSLGQLREKLPDLDYGILRLVTGQL